MKIAPVYRIRTRYTGGGRGKRAHFSLQADPFTHWWRFSPVIGGLLCRRDRRA